MKQVTVLLFMACCLSLLGWQQSAFACEVGDRDCSLEMIKDTAAGIENSRWRDQTYRELAKTYASDKELTAALDIIPLITSPDTQAMTIRGIGMILAMQSLDEKTYDGAFKQLDEAAAKIDHPPSHAIALTYIAMSHAFAHKYDKAWAVAASMENDALRHKAYAETAEIQAEYGDFDAAMESIHRIESQSFQNKAYSIISKIFADSGQLQEALDSAEAIDNPYKKAAAIQYVLDVEKPREVERVRKGTHFND